jgi:hypothetical protein
MPCHILDFGSLTLIAYFDTCITQLEGMSTLEIALGVLFGTCELARPSHGLRKWFT